MVSPRILFDSLWPYAHDFMRHVIQVRALLHLPFISVDNCGKGSIHGVLLEDTCGTESITWSGGQSLKKNGQHQTLRIESLWMRLRQHRKASEKPALPFLLEEPMEMRQLEISLSYWMAKSERLGRAQSGALSSQMEQALKERLPTHGLWPKALRRMAVAEWSERHQWSHCGASSMIGEVTMMMIHPSIS